MSVVTAVERVQKYVSIEVDGEFFVRLRRGVYRDLPLRESDEFDPQLFIDTMLPKAEYEPAMQSALAYLASRARTVHELKQRLLSAGYHDGAIERVIGRLETLGYLGDAQFAQDWAEARSNRAIGQRRMKQELRRKGVEDEAIEQALERLDPEAVADSALALAQKLFSKHEKEAPPARKQKVIQALVRRGYDWDQASQAYQAASEPEDF